MSDEWVPDEIFSIEELGGYGPLTIEVGRDESDGSFLAIESQTIQYGWGMSRDDALADLAKSLGEYHGDLREHGPGRLGIHLQGHLQYLEERLLAGHQPRQSVAV